MSAVQAIHRCCVLAAVGQGMVNRKGVAATMMSALAKANVNIKAIAQVGCAQLVLRGPPGAASSCGHTWPAAHCAHQPVLHPLSVGVSAPNSHSMRYFTSLLVLHPPTLTHTLTHTLQGSSEYNITVLIDQVDSERALRAVHSRFYLSHVPIGVGLIGPGAIGATLIEQLKEQRLALKEEFNIDLRVLGIASSSKMLLSETGIDLDNWREEFAAKVGGGVGRRSWQH